MGVTFGSGNTYSWHPGHLAPSFAGPPCDNGSNPAPPGPGWDADNFCTRCDYGADGNTSTCHTGLSSSGGSGSASCVLRTHHAVYGLRTHRDVPPSQTTVETKQAACGASTQLPAHMTSTFASLDINDTFLNVTVAGEESGLPLPAELNAYARRIVNMHLAPPSSRDASSMPSLIDPPSSSSSDNSSTGPPPLESWSSAYDSPDKPGPTSQPFGHSSQFVPDLPVIQLDTGASSPDIF
jgi:hypothetical protein